MIITSMIFTIAPIPPAFLVIVPMFSAISRGVSGELGVTPPTSVAIDCGLIVPFGNGEILKVEGVGANVGAAFEALAPTTPNVILRTSSPVTRILVLFIISPLKCWLHFGESTKDIVN
jgi:hypothetical protein